MQNNLVFLQFSRDQVEACDFGDFMAQFNPTVLPSGRGLRGLMNQLIFVVAGYNDDPREVYSVPEIRIFFRALYEQWPFWFYFCRLDGEFLWVMMFCCLESLSAVKVQGQPNCQVAYDRLELVAFLSRGLVMMSSMCERAGMSEREIYERTRDVFVYFKLPFDAPMPE